MESQTTTNYALKNDHRVEHFPDRVKKVDIKSFTKTGLHWIGLDCTGLANKMVTHSPVKCPHTNVLKHRCTVVALFTSTLGGDTSVFGLWDLLFVGYW